VATVQYIEAPVIKSVISECPSTCYDNCRAEVSFAFRAADLIFVAPVLIVLLFPLRPVGARISALDAGKLIFGAFFEVCASASAVNGTCAASVLPVGIFPRCAGRHL
jgi:hypothetical protein